MPIGGRAPEWMGAESDMRIANKSSVLLLVLALLGGVGGVGLLTLEGRSLVDWRELKAGVFESDDWGLAGFVPRADVWLNCQRSDLNPGRFPEVYWNSTLEDSLMVSQLSGIMASVVGRDGLTAVFQPNYVLSSLSYEKTPSGFAWKRYNWPQLPPLYQRPGLAKAVNQAREQGLWYPEFHATWHYDPGMRFAKALSTDLARGLTLKGVTLFPESEKARELGPWRSLSDLAAELKESLSNFENAFDRPAGSIIAPDYTWDGRIEKMWQGFGLKVIQAKREQRNSILRSGQMGRLEKFVLRKLDFLRHGNRVYLDRNCRLEPVQSPDAPLVVRNCLEETRCAWRSGKPAIVETHRVNFAHSDPRVVAMGQRSIQQYLDSICANPSALPVFLVDSEVAQLNCTGVSWVRRGKRLILRNGTQSRRLLTVSEGDHTRVFALSGGCVVVTQ